jgi:hypothetical protein
MHIYHLGLGMGYFGVYMTLEVKPIIRPILQALAHKTMQCVFELVDG